MVEVNTILYNQEEKREYRILRASKEQDIAYIYALACDKLPMKVGFRELEAQIMDGTLSEQHVDRYSKTVCEDELPESYKKVRDTIWQKVEKLVYQEPEIYDRHQRGKMIAELKADGIEPKRIYRYLKRYWQRGKNKNAFLPDYQHSGTCSEGAASSRKRKGRLPKYGGTLTRKALVNICVGVARKCDKHSILI